MAKFQLRALSASGLRKRMEIGWAFRRSTTADTDDPYEIDLKDSSKQGYHVPEGTTVYCVQLGLAVGGFLCGALHIVYCCQFYSSGVGVWNALVVMVMAIRGLCSWHPVGPHLIVYLNLIVLISGFIVTALTSTGIHCATKGCSVYVKGVRARDLCAQRFLILTGYSGQGLSDINLAIQTIMLVMGLAQIMTAFHIIRFYVVDFLFILKDVIDAYYLLSLLGLATLCFGIAHTIMCCHLFFTGSGVWLSAGIIATGICGHKKMIRNARTWRGVVAVCLWAGFVLAGVGGFGIYCWRPVGIGLQNNTKSICQEPAEWPDVYHQCYSRLEVLGYWDPILDAKMDGLRASQVTFSFLLILCGLSAGIGCMAILRKDLQNQAEAEGGTFV